MGDPHAQYDLAVEFYRGKVVPRDYAKAAVLWRRVAEKGDANARNNLGYLLYYGLGVPANPDSAVRLWRTAVLQGQPEASFHLGSAAADGKGTARDSVEAWARFRAAVLMAEASADSLDRLILDDARGELRGLRPGLTGAQMDAGERKAREYAAAPRAAAAVKP